MILANTGFPVYFPASTGSWPCRLRISAITNRNRRNRRKDDNPGDAQPDTRYLTTYYPGTYDAMQASAVTLKAGDEMPVNLTLALARAYRIRGIVTGIKAGQKAAVELVSKAGDSIHANEIGPDGQFEIRGVGPGSYMVGAVVGAKRSR